MRSLRFFLGLFVFLIGIALSSVSNAHVDQIGKVSRVIAESDVVSIWLGTATPIGECPDAGGRWTIKKDDPLFNSKLSMVLLAASTGRAVKLRSKTACGPWNSYVVYFIDLDFSSLQ